MTPVFARGESGASAERKAEEFLSSQGLAIIERNYRCRRGEIDLIMRDRETILFVEVRFRKNLGFGTPAETVTLGKQKKIIATARYFLQMHRNYLRSPCRFDVLAISGSSQENVDWIKDAFQPAV